MDVKESLIRDFPNLRETSFEITSPDDPSYNCVAWALDDTQNWWEPDPMGLCYWPPGVPRDYSLKSYREMFESFGYSVEDNEDFEPGRRKLAVFAKSGRFTHVSFQLGPGCWTSKLGPDEDIEHSLNGLVGELYGHVEIILKK